ncbi:acyl carrier protein [Streptomyces sp. BP-8]|uniref:Acyl carrier protein n=1 Tax=Streptomyces sirii TaxID=3127701 RepID=A0ABZ2QMC7_9ACTN
MSEQRDLLFMQLRSILVDKLRLPAEEVEPGASCLDLNLDSLDVVELSTALAKRCDLHVPATDLFAAATLSDIVALMEARGASSR